MRQRRFISTWTGLAFFCAAAAIRAQSPSDTIEVEWKASPRSTDIVEQPASQPPAGPTRIFRTDIPVAIEAPAPTAAPARMPATAPAPLPATAPVAKPAPAQLFSPYRPVVNSTEPVTQSPPFPQSEIFEAPAPKPVVDSTEPVTQSPPCPQPEIFEAPAPKPARVWGSAEYLGWWLRGNGMPTLVTTAPIGTFGTLDNPSTRTLFGNQDVSTNMMDGVRARLGFWIDPCATCGVEASFFGFATNNNNFQASSNGDPGLFRPFFNTSTNATDAEIVALQLPLPTGGYDPILSGTVSVHNSTDFYGGDANFRKEICGDSCYRLDALFGYRYMRLRDETSIEENLVSTDPLEVAAPLGTQILLIDRFQTTNTFNGGQIGLAGERAWGRWIASLRATVALGENHEQVKIDGSTTITTPPGTTATYAGGLLALPSNIGSYSSNVFSVIPEVDGSIGYQITQHLRVFAGYSFLYWSNVVRSGQQIDLVVNPTLIPNNGPASGPNRPAFQRVETNFWAQGFNVGIELSW